MAEEDEEVSEETEDQEEAAEGGGSKKKLIIIIAAVVVLLGGGGAAAFMLGLFGGSDPVEEEVAVVEELVVEDPPVYVDLPVMTVNLVQIDDRTQFLRVSISLEMEQGPHQAIVEQNQTRIVDVFQTYMRELRVTDLEGSAGVFRLKDELLRRVNLAAHPAIVDDILFKEMLVQ